jgi:hypothetical protein
MKLIKQKNTEFVKKKKIKNHLILFEAKENFFLI